jgi:hypothetical protein
MEIFPIGFNPLNQTAHSRKFLRIIILQNSYENLYESKRPQDARQNHNNKAKSNGGYAIDKQLNFTLCR